MYARDELVGKLFRFHGPDCRHDGECAMVRVLHVDRTINKIGLVEWTAGMSRGEERSGKTYRGPLDIFLQRATEVIDA